MYTWSIIAAWLKNESSLNVHWVNISFNLKLNIRKYELFMLTEKLIYTEIKNLDNGSWVETGTI